MAVFAPYHHLDDFVVGLCSRRVGGDVAAVAEHRAFVGEFRDLVHAVRDVEEREALRAQPLQHGKNLRDIGGGQRRGGLVENEYARFARQRLGDLHHLAARQGQILDQRLRMNVARTGARKRFLGYLPLRSPVDHAETLRRIGDDDIVGDAEFGDERQFLEDAGDAGLVGGGRRSEIHLLAFHRHAALVGRDDAGHDLDQRRLAGAVFAEDGMDAAGHDRKLGLFDCPDAAVTLGNSFHAEERNRPVHRPLPRRLLTN